jgi:hypothetical protein
MIYYRVWQNYQHITFGLTMYSLYDLYVTKLHVERREHGTAGFGYGVDG